MAKKLLTVFGATGNQGGSVIRTFLAHERLSAEWTVRAVTRDPSKDSAKALASQGCEVVKADLKDTASLGIAVQGSRAVFAVTNYWELHDPDVELQLGKNIADACKAAGVQHLVWSSLPNATAVSKGELPGVQHFDSKAKVEEYIESVKGDMMATYYMPAVFMPGLRNAIRRGPDGQAAWAACLDPTETQFPSIDIQADTGKWIAGILELGAGSNGEHVHAVGSWATPKQMVDDMSEVLGTGVQFKQVPPEVFQRFLSAAVAKELTENFLLNREFSYYGPWAQMQQEQSDRFLLKGEIKTGWREFVAKHAPWFE